MLRLFLAAMHLIALGIGLGAVWQRATALSGPLDRAAMVRAFRADTWWGIAAALWIATGLWRLLAGTEKGSSYYMHNQFFFAKMSFLVIILLLEARDVRSQSSGFQLLTLRCSGSRTDIRRARPASRWQRRGARREL